MAEENIKKEESKKEAPAKEAKEAKGKSAPTAEAKAATAEKPGEKGAPTKVEGKAEGAVKKSKGKKKAKRRLLTEGKVYIQSSFNNTIITVTDPKGEVIAWASSGSSGFKGPRKATPYAAQIAAEAAITKAKAFGLERVHVYVKGAGTGREQAVRGLQAGGVNIDSLTDVTPVPHNGCRSRKSRRV
jgi:small subunit ribosomal protein S11